MRSLTWILTITAAFLLEAVTSAQNYSIDWFKIAGGGGTSSGGQYSLSGTIGQPDAGGPLTGGNFSLVGGFWALTAVQTPGAPLLTITLTPTNTAVVSWPSPSSGFNPQVNTNLNTSNWIPPTQSVNDNGTIRYLLITPPRGMSYYRLQGP